VTGHSAMALYRHFDSMEHLHALLWNECFRTMFQEQDRGCKEGDTPQSRLRCRCRAYLKFCSEHPNLYWYMISHRPEPERFDVENMGDRAFGRWVALYTQGIERGVFPKDMDVVRSALKTVYVLLGAGSFIAARSKGVGGLNTKNLVEEAIEMAMPQIFALPRR